MFRVKKVLNHNTLIGIDMKDSQEYLLIGKGIGFGRKVSERLEAPEGGFSAELLEIYHKGAPSFAQEGKAAQPDQRGGDSD